MMAILLKRLSLPVAVFAAMVGIVFLAVRPVDAATFNGARNGVTNNGGYVELGGTLTKNTYINTAGKWIGIGTSSPRRTLHLNSGNNNSPFELQSTDPYALMTFSDDTTNTTNAVWTGALGNSLVVGQGATMWYSHNSLELSIDPTERTTDMYLDLDIISGEFPNEADCPSPVGNKSVLSATSILGRMIFDSVNNLLWICTTSGWNSIPVGGIPQN